MADNVQITAGSGTTIATDDVGGGVQVQRVKPEWGPDGTANDTDVLSGLPIQFHRPTSKLLSQAQINISSSGDNTVIAAVGGQTVRIHRMFLSTAATVSMKFGDTTVTYFTPAILFGTGGGPNLEFDGGEPWFITASGKGFVINLSAAVAVTGWIDYKQSA